MSLLAEKGRNFIVRHAGFCEVEQARTHFFTAGELGDGVDVHLYCELGDFAAAPDNPGQSNVVFATIENDFFDQTPQQRLAVRIRRGIVRPDLRQAPGKVDDLAVKSLAQRYLCDRLGRSLSSNGFLCAANLVQRRFPPTLEFAGDKAIVGVDAIELALCQRRGIAFALKFTLRAAAQCFFDLLLCPAGT
ncbi:hypothetical protein [Mesorhizobium sp. GR13]|uniref:hypothetical protein n=1 Tax=Mesorhizobium sp. GR13 TaxID=2562308 RepID=UPI0014855E88|nr:hypothetical protein [Mesorhizobium sp. GR13]